MKNPMENKKDSILESTDSEIDFLGRLLRLAGSRPTAPDELERRVKSNVHSHWSRSVRRRSNRNRVIWAAATAAACMMLYVISYKLISATPLNSIPVCIVAIATGEVNVSGTTPPGKGTVLSEGSVVRTGNDGMLFVRMLGGTSMRLDVNTSLQLESNSVFSLQQGAIYIDTQHSGRSVSIRTPMGDVKDQGTQFEIRLSEQSLRVRIREGTILLERGTYSKTASAGMELFVSKDGRAYITRIRNYGPDWNWIAEMPSTFHLEGRSLFVFLNWISRENGWYLRFADAQTKNEAQRILLHGSITSLKPEEMLAAVIPVTGADYSLAEGALTVRIVPE